MACRLDCLPVTLYIEDTWREGGRERRREEGREGKRER